MALAALSISWDRVLADAAFDSEANHRYCREDLRVRATVIPLNRRGRGRKWPLTPYRRQMVKRFRRKPKDSRHRRVYGQRWQAESAVSRHKRRLGSALGGRSDVARERECRLRVLTHDLMLLAAAPGRGSRDSSTARKTRPRFGTSRGRVGRHPVPGTPSHVGHPRE
jgi:hypothetical protein